MQEFDKHDVNTSLQLDHIEAERISKTPRLGAPETTQPGPSIEQAHHENDTKENTDDDTITRDCTRSLTKNLQFLTS